MRGILRKARNLALVLNFMRTAIKNMRAPGKIRSGLARAGVTIQRQTLLGMGFLNVGNRPKLCFLTRKPIGLSNISQTQRSSSLVRHLCRVVALMGLARFIINFLRKFMKGIGPMGK
jgi:hypothetical protein